MEEERKTRADFSTDSEWYTYKITHPENKEEEKEDEFPLIIVQCINCKNIIDENELEPKPDINIPYDKRLKCPKCGKKRFKYIKDKEEKEKILKELKEQEKKLSSSDLRLLKLTLKKIRVDLEDLRDELTEELKDGKITPARFCALLVNLTANIYKYYRNDDNISMYWSTFRDFAYETSKNVLESFYQNQDLEETMSNILAEYRQVQDFDLEYLERSKECVIQNITSGNECFDKNELESDLKSLEAKIESQEKYNDKVNRIVENRMDKYNEKDSFTFFKELARYNNV